MARLSHFATSHLFPPGRFARRFRAARGICGYLALAFGWPHIASATSYTYDANGRVQAVVSADGSSALYSYDSVGNITGIQRLTATQLALFSFAPTLGAPGQQVVIQGSGFSTTPGNNTVKFHALAATVVSSTANQIVATVPSAATTGSISVTVGASTATSVQTFTIALPPTITNFTPSVIDRGSLVTLNGTNLNPVAGSTSIRVGGEPVAIASLTSTRATFNPPMSGSEQIQITTPYGIATSTIDLIVAPNTTTNIDAVNILSSVGIVDNGVATNLGVNQLNEDGVIWFEATHEQALSLQLSSLTTSPAQSPIGYSVFSPLTMIAGGQVSYSDMSIHLPIIPTTGGYFIAFSSSGATLQLTAKLEDNTILNNNGTSAPISSTTAAQSKRATFAGTAGQSLGLALSNLAMTPSSGSAVSIAVINPDNPDPGSIATIGATLVSGNCLPTDPGCAISMMTLPLTGTYSVVVTPNDVATMSFALRLSQNVSGTLALNTPKNVNLTVPGQNALLQFTVTSSQTVALDVTSIVTVPANLGVVATVYDQTGAQVATTAGSPSMTLNLPKLVAGTYSVFISPNYGATATVQVMLASGLTGTLPTTGTSANYATTVPQQNGYFTFSGTAGQSLGLALTNLLLTPNSVNSVQINVNNPDGSSLTGTNCFTSDPGCGLTLMTLPQTGTYSVVVVPSDAATMSFTLTLSQDLGGTLALNSTNSVNLAVPGQNALFNFVATNGQSVTLTVASIVTNPTGNYVSVTVYDSTGAAFASNQDIASMTISLPSLSAGTYRALIAPSYGLRATTQVKIQ